MVTFDGCVISYNNARCPPDFPHHGNGAGTWHVSVPHSHPSCDAQLESPPFAPLVQNPPDPVANQNFLVHLHVASGAFFATTKLKNGPKMYLP